MFHSLQVKNNTVRKELPITLMITTAFAVLLSDSLFTKNAINSFTRGDGIILVLFFGVFMYYLISMARNKIVDDEEVTYPSMKKSIIFTLIGMAGIVIGSNFVVDGASGLAKIIGISDRMIALTIVALGTSLPELVTSVTATRKGEYDIAIGNVVGSNIFNIGMVVGIPVAILGGIPNINFSYVDIVIMLLAALMLFIFSLKDHKITKREGILFLLTFIVYYTYVIIG
jgi:cation:H+ antiporter